MLNEKIAVITGASRGIGAAIAKKMAENGATVIINYQGKRKWKCRYCFTRGKCAVSGLYCIKWIIR